VWSALLILAGLAGLLTAGSGTSSARSRFNRHGGQLPAAAKQAVVSAPGGNRSRQAGPGHLGPERSARASVSRTTILVAPAELEIPPDAGTAGAARDVGIGEWPHGPQDIWS
jgi:hypothetical protein